MTTLDRRSFLRHGAVLTGGLSAAGGLQVLVARCAQARN
nr:twin-arginine translocation signal domain-containing protein [Euzebyales bacterium]